MTRLMATIVIAVALASTGCQRTNNLKDTAREKRLLMFVSYTADGTPQVFDAKTGKPMPTCAERDRAAGKEQHTKGKGRSDNDVRPRRKPCKTRVVERDGQLILVDRKTGKRIPIKGEPLRATTLRFTGSNCETHIFAGDEYEDCDDKWPPF